jgi:hypothetical protein
LAARPRRAPARQLPAPGTAARDTVALVACPFYRILALPNQQADFLHRLFGAWSWMALAQITAERDTAEAAGYRRKIIESGVGGDMERDARGMLQRLRLPEG